MKIIIPLILVALFSAIAYFGVEKAGLQALFGIYIPYVAFLTFVIGFAARILDWMKTPVPFNITTTAGQQKSLPWIKRQPLENPSNFFEVVLRTLSEVLFFRSLFRNTEAKLEDGDLKYASNKWLWFFGIIFHWGFFLVALRHFRFFLPSLPAPIMALEQMDSILQVGVPALYQTDLLFIGGVTFLFFRRVVNPHMRYLSLVADFFPLMLIAGIGITGMLMRYLIRVDVMGIKALTMGLATFSIPSGEHLATLDPMFYTHLFLVSVLMAYFPFSKLMHMGGVFVTPSKVMANDSRRKRHVSPWMYEVEPFSYSDYEDQYRDKMKDAGIPVEKEE